MRKTLCKTSCKTPRNVLSALLVGAALLAAPAHAGVSIDRAESARTEARVVAGDLVVLNTDRRFAEVRVADADIADVTVLSDQSFHVSGKTAGRTNVLLYDSRSRLLDIVDVRVGHDLPGLRLALADAFPLERIQAKSLAGGIYLSGDVGSQDVAERAVQIAQAFAPERVTNGLSVRDSHQVLLEVRFVEATRNTVKSLGIGVLAESAGDLAIQAGTGAAFGAASLAGNVFADIGSVDLDARIEALEEEGMIRTLAEPNLVAMSGETASFLAGGEFPIPVPADLGQIAIEYRQFGVGLAFTPTVLDRGIISLRVAPEVSQIDTVNSVRIGGVEVPGLRVRRANTAVELRNSQSFAIAGLLSNEGADTKAQVPLLGDLPIIGSLFRSARYARNETELVIIVTPRLVQPVPDRSDLATPLDTMARPGEADLFFLGDTGVGRVGEGRLPSAATALERRQRELLGRDGNEQ